MPRTLWYVFAPDSHWTLPVLTLVAEAQAYEHAMDLTEEMARQHRAKTWNVERLAELTAYQAKLWEKIASVRRHKPEYYRVVSEMVTSFRKLSH